MDPRFVLVTPRYRRNGPSEWALGGARGSTENILLDYYYKAFDNKASSRLSQQEQLRLRMENQLLKEEIKRKL